MLAGAGGQGNDTSGVSSNLLGTYLSRTSKSRGFMFTGVYGAGKSEFAKRFSEQAKALCISFSISDIKESLVGNSESNMKRAMDIIEAIGGDGVFYIATSNRINQLPPELRRRFPTGTYFFSFPTKEERDSIWKIYLKEYELVSESEIDTLDMDALRRQEGLNDEDWTGAEIRTCCDMAWLLGCSLSEASKEVVPVKNTAKNEIERLKSDADGKYKDVSFAGLFQKNRPKPRLTASSSKSNVRDIEV